MQVPIKRTVTDDIDESSLVESDQPDVGIECTSASASSESERSTSTCSRESSKLVTVM